jgi:hypothetical protein
VRDHSAATRTQLVTLLRQFLLGALVAVLVFVPDSQWWVRVPAGLVLIAVFWIPPLVRIVTSFREGYRTG